MLIAQEVTREYRSGDQNLAVLKEVSFSIPQGAFVAIVGPSGSGKTTLLGLLAGLDTPTRGKVILDGHDLTTMSENDRARLRGEKVGFVFQTFQLIPTLTARENIQVPLELREAMAHLRAQASCSSAWACSTADIISRCSFRESTANCACPCLRQFPAHSVRRRTDGKPGRGDW